MSRSGEGFPSRLWFRGTQILSQFSPNSKERAGFDWGWILLFCSLWKHILWLHWKHGAKRVWVSRELLSEFILWLLQICGINLIFIFSGFLHKSERRLIRRKQSLWRLLMRRAITRSGKHLLRRPIHQQRIYGMEIFTTGVCAMLSGFSFGFTLLLPGWHGIKTLDSGKPRKGRQKRSSGV